MLLNRLTPTNSLGRLTRDMDRLFDEVFRVSRAPCSRPAGFPALNVWEDGDAFVVEAEVPGLTLEQLSVDVLGAELTIAGERRSAATEITTIHRRERGAGAFQRTLTLPTEINAEAVSADLKNGVLTIRLPKAETAKVRRIEVRAHE
ncbi:MAG TPA: Hsp20/alpha crystallin family protein [Phycisphaerae bacterium]|nr:Hsp20/alpha crystallin family protein [Phycisphaerae bacterium]